MPDFWLPDYRIIILIDGLYWHDNPAAEARDAPLIMAMERGTIDGQPINAVVRISDIKIQSCARDEVFDLALVGISSFP